MQALQGRTAIVTGGASGIGRAIVREFARSGARVVVADVRSDPREGGQPIIAELASSKAEVVFCATDVSDSVAVTELMETTVRCFDRIDIVVNNAAISLGKNLIDTPEDDWDRSIAANLKGPFLVAKHAVRRMLSQEPLGEIRGRIINIGSQFGFINSPEDFAYGIAKAGIIQMTRQIAVEYAANGIICNAVSPGKIDTGKGGSTMEPRWVDFSRQRTPMPRLGRPDDVARAVAFLASDASTFTTGANLMVDGGWLAA
jgi:NAD(P)-dependent dehydrogenase (short-subunit alcohol dehydrogenase family)